MMDKAKWFGVGIIVGAGLLSFFLVLLDVL